MMTKLPGVSGAKPVPAVVPRPDPDPDETTREWPGCWPPPCRRSGFRRPAVSLASAPIAVRADRSRPFLSSGPIQAPAPLTNSSVPSRGCAGIKVAGGSEGECGAKRDRTPSRVQSATPARQVPIEGRHHDEQ